MAQPEALASSSSPPPPVLAAAAASYLLRWLFPLNDNNAVFDNYRPCYTCPSTDDDASIVAVACRSLLGRDPFCYFIPFFIYHHFGDLPFIVRAVLLLMLLSIVSVITWAMMRLVRKLRQRVLSPIETEKRKSERTSGPASPAVRDYDVDKKLPELADESASKRRPLRTCQCTSCGTNLDLLELLAALIESSGGDREKNTALPRASGDGADMVQNFHHHNSADDDDVVALRMSEPSKTTKPDDESDAGGVSNITATIDDQLVAERPSSTAAQRRISGRRISNRVSWTEQIQGSSIRQSGTAVPVAGSAVADKHAEPALARKSSAADIGGSVPKSSHEIITTTASADQVPPAIVDEAVAALAVVRGSSSFTENNRFSAAELYSEAFEPHGYVTPTIIQAPSMASTMHREPAVAEVALSLEIQQREQETPATATDDTRMFAAAPASLPDVSTVSRKSSMQLPLSLQQQQNDALVVESALPRPAAKQRHVKDIRETKKISTERTAPEVLYLMPKATPQSLVADGTATAVMVGSNVSSIATKTYHTPYRAAAGLRLNSNNNTVAQFLTETVMTNATTVYAHAAKQNYYAKHRHSIHAIPTSHDSAGDLHCNKSLQPTKMDAGAKMVFSPVTSKTDLPGHETHVHPLA